MQRTFEPCHLIWGAEHVSRDPGGIVANNIMPEIKQIDTVVCMIPLNPLKLILKLLDTHSYVDYGRER